MKAPDKIYANDYGIWYKEEQASKQTEQYIRKDALLKWAKEKFSETESKARGYSIGVSAGRYLAYIEVIEKLNEM